MKITTYSGGILIPKIDTYLDSLNKESSVTCGQRIIRPSGIAGCARAIVYDILGIPAKERNTPQTQRIFDNGHGVHHRIENYLEKMKLFDVLSDGKPAREVALSNDEYWIKGTCDGILNIEGMKFILEIKSINTWKYSTLEQPEWYYLDQIHLYFYCSGIPQGIFLYENKDTQVLREFIIEQDDERLNKLLDKIRFIQDCVKKGVLPAMDCQDKSKAKYCKYIDHCFPAK